MITAILTFDLSTYISAMTLDEYVHQTDEFLHLDQKIISAYTDNQSVDTKVLTNEICNQCSFRVA